jgi:hypothetical protein
MKILNLLFIVLLFVGVCSGQTKKKSSPKPTPTPAPAELQKTDISETLPPIIKPCELTLKDAPEVRGLKLGMPEDEIVNLFSIKKDYVLRPDDTEGISEGVIVVDFPPTLWKVPPTFKGIKLITFKIYFGKVYSLGFAYEPTEIKFENSRQFAQNISKTF